MKKPYSLKVIARELSKLPNVQAVDENVSGVYLSAGGIHVAVIASVGQIIISHGGTGISAKTVREMVAYVAALKPLKAELPTQSHVDNRVATFVPDDMDQLRQAFDRVQNSKGWKLPIRRTLPATVTEEELTLIDRAITHFAGGGMRQRTLPDGKIEIRASGYYKLIGA